MTSLPSIFAHSGQEGEDEDDLVFLLDSTGQVSAHRRPLKHDMKNIDFDASTRLNQVCHARYIVAATVCSVQSTSQVIITQRCLVRCYASPILPTPNVSFATLDVLDQIILSPSESLLCLEVIRGTAGSFEDLQVGDAYRSLRGCGKSVFEGSIDYSDTIHSFTPIRRKKQITLRGPWGKGLVTLNASRPHYTVKELAQRDHFSAPISVQICSIEMDWKSMQRLISQ